MGRPRKDGQAKGGSDLDRLSWYLDQLHTAESDRSDAGVVITSIYRQAKEAGVHVQALRLVRRLKKLDPLKLTEFLRCFDQYRHIAGLDQQPELEIVQTNQPTAAE